jgi:hypothetical protein
MRAPTAAPVITTTEAKTDIIKVLAQKWLATAIRVATNNVETRHKALAILNMDKRWAYDVPSGPIKIMRHYVGITKDNKIRNQATPSNEYDFASMLFLAIRKPTENVEIDKEQYVRTLLTCLLCNKRALLIRRVSGAIDAPVAHGEFMTMVMILDRVLNVKHSIKISHELGDLPDDPAARIVQDDLSLMLDKTFWRGRRYVMTLKDKETYGPRPSMEMILGTAPDFASNQGFVDDMLKYDAEVRERLGLAKSAWYRKHNYVKCVIPVARGEYVCSDYRKEYREELMKEDPGMVCCIRHRCAYDCCCGDSCDAAKVCGESSNYKIVGVRQN